MPLDLVPGDPKRAGAQGNRGEVRRGHEAATELLADHGELHVAEPTPAIRDLDGQAGQAKLYEVCPSNGVVPTAVVDHAPEALMRRGGIDKSLDRPLESLLLIVQREGEL